MNKTYIKKGLATGMVFLLIAITLTPMVIGNNDINGQNELIFQEKNIQKNIETTEGLIDHIWHQQGYNAQHIGRSPYSTENTLGIEKWRFPAEDWCDGSPVINDDGKVNLDDIFFVLGYWS